MSMLKSITFATDRPSGSCRPGATHMGVGPLVPAAPIHVDAHQMRIYLVRCFADWRMDDRRSHKCQQQSQKKDVTATCYAKQLQRPHRLEIRLRGSQNYEMTHVDFFSLGGGVTGRGLNDDGLPKLFQLP